MTQPTTIDLSLFDKLKRDVGEDYIGELIDTYLADTPKTLEIIRKALAEGKIDEMRLAAHAIKSTSATFGAAQFSALAKDLEMLGKSNTLTGAADLFKSLESQYPQVARDLRKLRGE